MKFSIIIFISDFIHINKKRFVCCICFYRTCLLPEQSNRFLRRRLRKILRTEDTNHSASGSIYKKKKNILTSGFNRNTAKMLTVVFTVVVDTVVVGFAVVVCQNNDEMTKKIYIKVKLDGLQFIHCLGKQIKVNGVLL